MKSQNFERELPSHYTAVLHLNAQNLKIGLIFNLIAFVVMAAVVLLAALPFFLSVPLILEPGAVATASTVLLLAMVLYIILHELVHGLSYRILTGEKLTFGLTWSCAFCGVPHIFTYRKTALISILSPFTVFTLLLLPLTICLYSINPAFYLASALLLAIHLGGCSGDLWLAFLLLFRFRDPRLLMRDTGPEQFLYLPSPDTNP